jgi:PEP-CTERM motif
MKKISIVTLFAMLAAVSMVRADIIPNFAFTSPGSGTSTVWNYSIDITSNQQVTAGDFFTIYDFGPFIAGSNVQPTGWTFSSSLVTPPPSNTTPPDDPTLQNLTWTYMGATAIPTGTHLGPFAVAQPTSVFQEVPSLKTGFFAAQATRNDSSGSKINNVGQVPVPVPVPEPTTLSLLALAGVGSALKAIRRRK